MLLHITTQCLYDALNRLERITYADGTTLAADHDSYGDLAQVTDANGTVRGNYAHDDLGRTLSFDVSPGPGVSSETTTRTYAYDGLSRLTRAHNDDDTQADDSTVTFTYDSLGRVLRESLRYGGITRHVDAGYNAAGDLLSLVYPGGRAVNLDRDALGRVSRVWDEAGANDELLARYTYLGPWRVHRKAYFNRDTNPTPTNIRVVFKNRFGNQAKFSSSFFVSFSYDNFMARPALEPNPEKASIHELKAAARVGTSETAARCTAIQMLIIGISREPVCQALLVSSRAILKWIHAFHDAGVDGLTAHKRPGRSRKIPREQASHLVALLENPEHVDRTHGTARAFHGSRQETDQMERSSSAGIRFFHEQNFALKVPHPWPDRQDETVRNAFRERRKTWHEQTDVDLGFMDESGFEGECRSRRRGDQKGRKTRVIRNGDPLRMNVICGFRLNRQSVSGVNRPGISAESGAPFRRHPTPGEIPAAWGRLVIILSRFLA